MSEPKCEHEQIKREIESRAHELHVQHGRHHERDLEDWLEAEAEVLRKHGLPTGWCG